MSIRRLTAGVVRLAMVASAVGLICGCGENSVPTQGALKNEVQSQPDYRASFEAFMKGFISNIQPAFDEDEERNEQTFVQKNGKWDVTRRKLTQAGTIYDVQKTTSLVTPYEGTFEVTFTTECIRSQWNRAGEKSTGTITFRFGLKDGKWKPMTLTDKKGSTQSAAFLEKPGHIWGDAYLKTSQ